MSRTDLANRLAARANDVSYIIQALVSTAEQYKDFLNDVDLEVSLALSYLKDASSVLSEAADELRPGEGGKSEQEHN